MEYELYDNMKRLLQRDAEYKRHCAQLHCILLFLSAGDLVSNSNNKYFVVTVDKYFFFAELSEY